MGFKSIRQPKSEVMDVERFFMRGAALSTLSYGARGGPLPPEPGEFRSRWETFQVGPYEARFGIVGEIKRQILSLHDLMFEIDFGHRKVSALKRRVVVNEVVTHQFEWVEEPSDAEVVALALLNFG